MKPTLLIVDDEKPSREGLRAALEGRYDVYLAENAQTATEILATARIDLLLSDLRMPGEDGLKLIQRAKMSAGQPVCILMTAYGSEELAVEAMKQGADDYIPKGRMQLDELELRIARLLKTKHLEAENVQLQQALDQRYGLHAIVGESAALQQVLDTVKQVAPSRATILLEGESGTGKELAAQALHQLSTRARGRFIAVHCAALSPTLLESELFGHEKGSFTGATERRQGRFELADGGTLFLDEIGEIDPNLQVKVLRVLDAQQFERVGGTQSIQTDVRVVVATNRNLRKMVGEGKFREDLFFRLNVISIRLPSLRERREDIPLLVNHFLKEFNAENNKSVREISPPVMQLFQQYPWPGNIRELRNAMNRMVVLCRSQQLTLDDVPPELKHFSQGQGRAGDVPADQLNLAEMEQQLIRRALERTGGNISRAAPLLGLSRRTLHRKLKEMQMVDPSSPSNPHTE